MNNKQVAHLWANKSKSSARGSNFYFEGDTIYSYGGHFPIARHFTRKGKACVLFTSRTYSSSTARHKSYTRNAIHNALVFEVDDVFSDPAKNTRENVRRLSSEIAKAADKAARSKVNFEWAYIRLQGMVESANQFAEFFDYRQRFTVPDLGDVKAKIAKQRQAALIAAEKARLAEEVRNNRRRSEVPAWKRGEPIQESVYSLPEIYLRFKPGTNREIVETSKGAEVPTEHALKLLPFIRAGKDWHRNGQVIRVGHFHVDAITPEGDITAGCHRIARGEMEALAAEYGA